MSDIEKFQEHMADMQQQYGAFFKDKQQLELFAMIPLSKQQRKELMIRMIKDAHAAKDAAERKSDENTEAE